MSGRLSRKRNVDSTHGSRDSSSSSQVRCGCQYFQTDSLLPEKQSLVGLKPNITTIMNTLSKTNDMIAPTPDSEVPRAAANVPVTVVAGETASDSLEKTSTTATRSGSTSISSPGPSSRMG